MQARGFRGTTTLGSGTSLEPGVLLKDPCCEEIDTFWKTSSMRIVWRNSNKVAQNPVSVVCTGGSDESGQLRRFYQSRAGLGILGTNFELWVNCERSSSAA